MINMKLKFVFAGIFGLLLIFSVFYFFLLGSVAQESPELVWRPTCDASVQGTTTPISEPLAPWKESWDGSEQVTYCYFNSSIIYIQKPIFYNFLGEPFTGTYPDTYITDVAYTQPTGPLKIGDIRIEFDMYFPYYQDNPSTCYAYNQSAVDGRWNIRQFVLAANNNANFTETVNTFNDAFYQLTSAESLCGQWIKFSHLIKDFTDDYGVSFNRNSRTLEIVGLEMGNVYIKNITVVGASGAKTLW